MSKSNPISPAVPVMSHSRLPGPTVGETEADIRGALFELHGDAVQVLAAATRLNFLSAGERLKVTAATRHLRQALEALGCVHQVFPNDVALSLRRTGSMPATAAELFQAKAGTMQQAKTILLRILLPTAKGGR